MSSSVNAISIAKKVLELIELDDYEGILNLGVNSSVEKISKTSPPEKMKKAYLKLSLVIHPDRMGKSFPEATKAFQALVRAFEYLSEPEVIEEKSSKSKKDKPVAISRSNEGCYRTRVCCPRCKQPWSEGTLDGNPDYFYNFLMTGLKQYTCSTCLCEFGCMTAIHNCPFCKKQFEYSPQDYHKKIKCSNNKCSKSFGFMLYHASDRAIKDTKQSVKEEQERRLKAREAKQRRANRSNRKDDSALLESSFMLGLSDICPRCGEDFTEIEDEEEQRRHLMECTNEEKHKTFKKQKTEEEEKKNNKMKKQEAQEAVQTHASWQMLGSNTSQLWLLDEEQLRTEAKNAKIDSSGDKDDLISRLVKVEKVKNKSSNNKKSSSLLLTNNDNNNNLQLITASSSSKKRKSIDRDQIPSNIYSMSLSQLRSVCASFDLLHLIQKQSTKEEILAVLENEFYDKVDNNNDINKAEDTKLLL